MKKSILVLFLIICSFIFPKITQASHLTGGDIVYECVGQDSFLVTLTLFRDCSGVTAPPNAILDLTSGCGSVFTVVLTKDPTVVEVSQICASMVSSSTCNGGSLFGLEAHSYSALVTLNPACNAWTLSNSTCCRNTSIVNLQNPGGLNTHLQTTLYSSTFPSNSSPYFAEFGMPTIFSGQTSQFNLGAVDPDGDSLVYFMAPAYGVGTSMVPYNLGYTFLQPLGGSGVTLNSSNGQLSITPSTLGVFVVNVRVEEYDMATGLLKGTIRRDFQVTVIASSQNAPQFSASGMINLANGTLSSGTLYACLGDSLDFNISLSDVNISDTLSVTHTIYSALDTTAVVTITGTNPLTVNVKWNVNSLGYRSVSIRGTDGICPIPGVVSENFQIIISPGTYAGEDVSMCDGDTAILVGLGGTSYSWVSISGSTIDTNPNSPTYNMTCNNCSSPEVFPNMTTTYVLVTNVIGVCGNTDTVTVNVSSNFSIVLPNDTLICGSDSLPLVANCFPSGLNYTYNWFPGSLVSDPSIYNPKALFSQNATISVEVGLNGCSKWASMNVGVQQPLPSGISLIGDTMICQGDSTQLELILPSQTVVTTLCSSQTPSILGTGSGIIGTAGNVTTQTSFPNVYGRFYWGVKHQILYTVPELLAMGMVSGSEIKSLGFDVVNVGSPNNMDNFTIKMGCTTNTTMGTTWGTGLVTVLQSQLFLPAIGWNTHVFDNSYVWDGVSNLLVEICSNNSNYSSAATSTIKYTSTTNGSVLYYRADNANVCGNLTTNTLSNDRPNSKFEFTNAMDTTVIAFQWQANPGLLSTSGRFAMVGPLSNTTFEVVVTDTFGICVDTLTKNIYVNTTAFDAGFVFDSVLCINGAAQTLAPITPGGIFTGSGVTSTGIFDPANAGVGTWNINYFIPTPVQCSNDSTMSITVLPLPDATVTLAELCLGASNIFLSAATPGGVWSGAGIVDTLTGEFSTAGLQLGNSSVTYTLHNPCENSETATIRIIEPFQFTVPSHSIKICEGSTANLLSHISLSGAPFQGSHPVMTFFDVDGFVDISGVFDAQGASPGIYSVDVTVTDSTGNCGATQTFSVEVNGIDYASIISDPTFCISESNAKIFVQPWLYGAGVTFSQIPLSPLGAYDTLLISPFGQNGQFTPSVVGVGSWELTIHYTNTSGCVGTFIDTVYVLDNPDTLVAISSTALSISSGNGYAYQWLDCDDNMNPITGANSATFTPTSSGIYAVEIVAGNCSETSNCHPFIVVGIEQVINTNGVEVFPNPIEEWLTVRTTGNETVHIQVLDNSGKVIISHFTQETELSFSVADLASGVYLIKIEGDNTHFTQKVIKK